MSPISRKWGLIVAVVLVGGAVLVAGSVLVDPFIPSDMSFHTEDLDARAEFEKIVAAHGYSFHYAKNVHGETLVVVEGITAREYLPIDCAFFAWEATKLRYSGVVVYDRPECAL